MTYTQDDLIDIVLDTTGLWSRGPRHDAPLNFPQNFDFAATSKWNPTRTQIGTPGLDHIEWRGAVIAEWGDSPQSTFTVEIARPQMWGMSNGNWFVHYEPVLVGTGKGGYLGDDDRPNVNPFESGRGRNTWRQVGDRHYATNWMVDSVLLHFWAGLKKKAPAGYSAEMATCLIRILNAPDNHILGGAAPDYYPSATTNNHKAPGPGIQRYRTLTSEWEPFAWVTPTPSTALNEAGMRGFVREYGLPTPSMMELLPPGGLSLIHI